MGIEFKRKMYMGIGKSMVPVPRWIAALGLRRSASGARAKAATLSPEERRLHHFVVGAMATATEPLTIEAVAQAVEMTESRAREVVEKLEGLKTFFFRDNCEGINWAFPLSLEDTGHRIVASTGERFFAA